MLQKMIIKNDTNDMAHRGYIETRETKNLRVVLNITRAGCNYPQVQLTLKICACNHIAKEIKNSNISQVDYQ